MHLQGSYNLRNDFPGLYETALESTKTGPVPNYTVISDWADSMRAVGGCPGRSTPATLCAWACMHEQQGGGP